MMLSNNTMVIHSEYLYIIIYAYVKFHTNLYRDEDHEILS